MVSKSCSASSSSTTSSLLPWPREKPPGDAVGKAMIPGVRLIRIIRADPALPFFQGRRRGARQLQEVRDPLLGEPPDTPGTQSHLFQERVCVEFPPPQWQVCRRHCQHVGLGTTSNCWRTPRRGRAVNQRRRSGTCQYRTPHTPPEARGGRFSWSRAPRPETESSPGTSGSRFRQRPKVWTKVWTWPVAPQAGVNPFMAGPIAAFPNVMSFNCSTQGSGRPAGRRHPRAIAGSVSLWCGDNPTLVVHAASVSQFVPTGCLVRRANQFLNLVRRPHTPQANATPRSTADSARGADTRPTMALIPAGAPHADINGRSPGTERLQSQWLGGRRKSRLAGAWTTRVEATIPKSGEVQPGTDQAGEHHPSPSWRSGWTCPYQLRCCTGCK